MLRLSRKQTEEDHRKENFIFVLNGSDQPNDLNQKNNKESSLGESAEKSIATKEDHKIGSFDAIFNPTFFVSTKTNKNNQKMDC